jgi:hypothetical protein
LEALVDGRNRLVDQQRLDVEFAPARLMYAETPERLRLSPNGADAGEWMARYLTGSNGAMDQGSRDFFSPDL